MPKPSHVHVPSQLFSSGFSRIAFAFVTPSTVSVTATLFSLILIAIAGLRLVLSAPTPRYYLNYDNNTKNDHVQQPFQVQVGLRPYYLVDNMDEGPLKQKLQSCSEKTSKVSKFVVGHRGAPLQFPEHTRESYMAAAREGAGAIECDVTFTSDKKLVCRHDQCDLHYTTNILATDLAAKCTRGFTPYDVATGTDATANCCASDITLAEFKTLCGKMDGFNPNASTAEEFMAGTAKFRTDLYSTCGTLLTHVESIHLIDSYGRDFTPEAKHTEVQMPFNGYTQEQYLQDIIDDYKNLGIDPARVWPQSFVPDDVFWWIKNEPEFGKQAVYLDERMETLEGYNMATASLPALAQAGVKIVGPALFALTKLDTDRKIVPSEYAIEARKAGLEILPWSFERSGWLNQGGEYFYQYIAPVIRKDGDMYTVLDVLVNDVGVFKMYSDSPATVVYYANCMGLP
ncbi:Extracellular protein [Lachnellula hyalina]|uniref:glycerophosphodiester phosphodiesterase n=1 Tax=Lachnellula hyalina TaxID=1316788 RepID=A0A8H8QV75_9HELO|nr:Extracellular protein [Lachnellula hyalina]TVY23131.1 Extracellular protein [Lachnellula hyalina]